MERVGLPYMSRYEVAVYVYT